MLTQNACNDEFTRRESRVFRFGKQHGRSVGGVQSTLHGGEFEIRINLFVELDQLPGAAEVVDAGF